MIESSRHPHIDDADHHLITYPVVETFHSVQGEGIHAGVSAFFIRLAGCDVGCWFCDTKHSWDASLHSDRSVFDPVSEALAARPAAVIITGGEPLMHDLGPITHELRTVGLPVHLETSGSHPFSSEFDWVTLSPKKFKWPHASDYPHTNELKVVVVNGSDFAWAEHHASQSPNGLVKMLQPLWVDGKISSESRQLIVEYVLRNHEWRISLQTHKLLEVR